MAANNTVMSVIIVTPAFNEAENMPLFFDRLRPFLTRFPIKKVIIVDDGSSDGTAKAAYSVSAEIPVEVVTHKKNSGVGEAFRSGFAAALREADAHSIIVTMEADNTGEIDALPRMVQLVQNGEAELVLASCYAKNGSVLGTNFYRLFLSRCANVLLKCIFPRPRVSTYSSFYRAYSVNLLKKTIEKFGSEFITEPGFVCVVEMLFKFATITGKISEVPIRLSINERKGKSKMRPLRTALSYLGFITKNFQLRKSIQQTQSAIL